jgi:6-phosphofructo-2-kinase/fructose-2,6-biphosphatase 4
VQAGVTLQEESFKADASLSPQGVDYARKMSETLLRHREEERAQLVKKGAPDAPLKPLIVWTSSRRRTIETSSYLAAKGYRVRQRSQMSQMNPGVCEKKSEKRIREEYPDEVEKHELDPYHHRFPRAEVRIKPLYVAYQELTYTSLIMMWRFG